ncbi:MAG: glycosyltransferase family 2 protein [Marinosulfonomonas sp.]
MTGRPVSVVIVSHGRPNSLKTCLRAVRQLVYSPFEIVVVSDGSGLNALRSEDLTDHVKTVRFEDENISLARNLGIGHAAGEVVAFIDDDAVPEPAWLYHLIAPFEDPNVDAATGYVLGRNGISFQSQAHVIDAFGVTSDLPAPTDRVSIHSGQDGTAIKTPGTNCAFRRSLFSEIGGFDSNYRYYLEDSDLNMRIGACGKKTAVVPLAQVHHSVAESARRTSERVATSLYEIGASTAVFLCKFLKNDSAEFALKQARAAQRKIVLRQMVAGTCEPREVARLMSTFDSGAAAGRNRAMDSLVPIAGTDQPFLPFGKPNNRPEHRVLSGHYSKGKSLKNNAKTLSDAGCIVSLFLFSRTSLYHRLRYHPDGYWLQTGGVYGKARRNEPVFRRCSLAARTRRETGRVSPVRFPWDGQNELDEIP